jgi:Domain of unknown function (DUF5753)
VLQADQLEHLITLTELPTVSIQVMPLAAGVGDTILTQYIKGLP